jgi:hypothetical protein
MVPSPVTSPGIDPETFRLVAQCLNHYATPGPQEITVLTNIIVLIGQNTTITVSEFELSRLKRTVLESTSEQTRERNTGRMQADEYLHSQQECGEEIYYTLHRFAGNMLFYFKLMFPRLDIFHR